MQQKHGKNDSPYSEKIILAACALFNIREDELISKEHVYTKKLVVYLLRTECNLKYWVIIERLKINYTWCHQIVSEIHRTKTIYRQIQHDLKVIMENVNSFN